MRSMIFDESGFSSGAEIDDKDLHDHKANVGETGESDTTKTEVDDNAEPWKDEND